tara:strand:- start:1118 stop:1363 length:246 start_codon:yes stop_codon:yes gene_type:complete
MEHIIKNDQIKIKILKEMSSKDKITPSRLATNLKYKYETIKKSLVFLEKISLVKKEIMNHGKKDYVYYQLTKLGKEVSKNA